MHSIPFPIGKKSFKKNLYIVYDWTIIWLKIANEKYTSRYIILPNEIHTIILKLKPQTSSQRIIAL